MSDKIEGYDMEEEVGNYIHMLAGVEKGNVKYHRLIADLMEYQELAKNALKPCTEIFPNLTELLTATVIAYYMMCNEAHATEEVSEDEKTIASVLLMVVLEKFDLEL